MRTLILLAVTLAAAVAGTQPDRRALSSSDIDDIAILLQLEDTRTYDEARLHRLLRASHPEVRRRAAIAIGRIADRRGRAMLEAARGDGSVEVAAAVIFAIGQLKDPAAVPALLDVLARPETPSPVAREAARALGKIRAPEARAALATFLAAAPAVPAAAGIVGEALLSIGRFPEPGDLAPVTRWASSPNPDIAWRAAWALFRPRDPAAQPALLSLSRHASAEVRYWAVRGLAAPPANAGAEGPATTESATYRSRLREALADPDRRVRTEALRALGTYRDGASFDAVFAAMASDDIWLSMSAAEALARFESRRDQAVPALARAVAADRPLALRLTALPALRALAPESAVEPAAALATVDSATARQVAGQPAAGRGGRRAGAGTAPAPPPPARSLDDYRRIVTTWVVPDYMGRPAPRLLLETPRGSIEVELFAGDAPLATAYTQALVESGDLAGTEFGRVVPNFVAQMRAARNAARLRDEVNQRGLLRGTLSWASSGLDTGRPGYTLGFTPQPHNEGDFTALGRVVQGLDVMDRLELGDAVLGARFIANR
jgi:peptidylprolyl isomerase